MESIPNELKAYIVSYLSKYDNFFVQFVNNDFKNLITKKKKRKPTNSIIFKRKENYYFVKSLNYKISKRKIYTICLNNNSDIEMLDEMYKILGNKYLIPRLYNIVIINQNLNLVKWLREHYCPYNNIEQLYLVAKYDIYNYICKRCPLNEETLIEFFKNKNNRTKENLELIFKSIPQLYEYFCEIACIYNDIDFLKICLEKKEYIYKSWSSCSYAVQNNNLEMLKLLKEEYYFPWNYWTTTEAVIACNLEILSYAISKDCTIEHDVLYYIKDKHGEKYDKIRDMINKI